MFKKRLNKLKRKLVTVLSLAMVLSGFPVVPCEVKAQTPDVGWELFVNNITDEDLQSTGREEYTYFINGSIYSINDSIFTIYDNYPVDSGNSIYKIVINKNREAKTGVSSASSKEAIGCIQFNEIIREDEIQGEVQKPNTYINFTAEVDSEVAVVVGQSDNDIHRVYLKEGDEDPKEAVIPTQNKWNTSVVLFKVAANKSCKLYADSGVCLYYIKVMPKSTVSSWDFTYWNIFNNVGVEDDFELSKTTIYIDGLYFDVSGDESKIMSLNRAQRGVTLTKGAVIYIPVRDDKLLYINSPTGYNNIKINNDKCLTAEENLLSSINESSDRSGYVKAEIIGDSPYDEDKELINKTEIKNISWVSIAENPNVLTNLVYTGAAQTGVKEGTGYELYEIFEATNAGTYTATAKLNDGYVWSDGTTADKTITWSIDKVPLTITANDKTITYGDGLSNDGVGYSGFVNNEDSSVLVGALSYAYTYEQNNDAGEYLITPSGLTSDNYDITFVSGKLTVQKKDITNTEITASSAKTLTYNGSPQELVTAGSAKENGVEVGTMYYAVTTGDTVPEESAYTTSIPSATDVGSYNVWYKVIGDKNHNYNNLETQKINVTIAKPKNNDLNVSMEGWTYGDKQTSPKVTGLGYATADITYSNKEDGTYTTEKPLTPGTWWVKANVAETDNYPAGVAINSFVIAPKEITITADSASKVYDGTAFTKDGYTYSEDSLAYEDKISGVTVTGSQTAVGSSNNVPSEAVIKNSDNTDVTNCYNITYANGTLTVAKRPLQITAVAKSKKFGESDPELTYTSGDLVGDDKITGTLTRTEGENAGTYAITQGTLTAGDNYEISFVGADLTIEKADSITGAPIASKSVDYTVDTVGKVELPDNWTWKTADINKELTVGAAVEATAEYTGSDKDNYADTAKYVTISIIRNACTHDNLEDKSEVPASCTKEGILAHSKCPVCNKLFVKDDDKLVEKTADELKIEAVGHSYGKATYSWSDDHATCTATKVCMREGCDENSEGHVVTETVKTTSETTPAGCEEKGVITYTATFTDKDFGTVTDSVDIAAKNHDYVITYEWSEDGKTCTATAVCKNDSTHKVTETAEYKADKETSEIKATVKETATTEKMGTTTYTASFKNALFTAQTKDVVDIPKVEKTADTPATPVENNTTTVVKEEGTTIPVADNNAEVVVTSKPGEEPSVAYKGTTDEGAKAIEIPETVVSNGVTYAVTEISEGAFENNKAVESVKLGDNITTIGENAFAGCTNLKSVELSKNIKELLKGTFKDCTSLKKVDIPKNVKIIGDKTFSGCSKLATMNLKNNVTEIGEKAFEGCTSLKKVTLGKNVTKIGGKAFNGAKKLKTITIQSKKLTKKSVKGAFKGSKINTIKVDTGSKALNKKLVKKYKKIFTKKNIGRKVTIK